MENRRILALLGAAAAVFAALGACGNSTSDTGAGASSGANGSGGQASSSSGHPSGTSTSGSTSSGTADGGSSTGSGGAPPMATLHFIGRWDESDPAHPSAAWPGSAIYAHFLGSGVTLGLTDDGDNYLTVVVDDGMPQVVHTGSAGSTFPLATNLSPGEHKVWIEKMTESYQGTIHFQSLTAVDGAPLPETPAPYTRFVEMVGDSITCGYGVLGSCTCGGTCCGFTAATEDEYIAYGAINARSLAAAHAGISYSGIGVYRDGSGSTTDQMPVKYERTFADDANSTWTFSYQPDVVVINLGTNDFAQGDPGSAYVTAMVAFVKQVRGHYAKAFIVLATGPMLGDPNHTTILGYLHNVITQVGDAKVSLVDLSIQACDANLGCDYHPGVAEQATMASMLKKHISSVTGW